MNAPIQAVYQVTQNLYAVIFNNDDGKVWNQTSQLWETYSSVNWVNYAVPLTEYTGSGYYRAAYPIPANLLASLTTELIYARAGAFPALGDTPASNLFQSQGANVAAVGNLWQPAQNMAKALGTQQLGAIVGTPATPYLLTTDLTSTEIDTYAGRTVLMTSGALNQQASRITAFDPGLNTLTILGFPSGVAPADTDTFVII